VNSIGFSIVVGFLISLVLAVFYPVKQKVTCPGTPTLELTCHLFCRNKEGNRVQYDSKLCVIERL